MEVGVIDDGREKEELKKFQASFYDSAYIVDSFISTIVVMTLSYLLLYIFKTFQNEEFDIKVLDNNSLHWNYLTISP
jgi:hypothetical protein